MTFIFGAVVAAIGGLISAALRNNGFDTLAFLVTFATGLVIGRLS